MHTLAVPVIDAGDAVTVSDRVTVHPPPSEYVIVTVPGDMPVTPPLSDPINAVAGWLLVHTPPLMLSVRVAAAPAQIDAGPDMADGPALTVTIAVDAQVVGSV